MPDAPSGALDLYCRDEGEGPVLLLLHGVGGTHTIWNEVVPALSSRFRLLAPDLRGHGRSPLPRDAPAGFAEMQADLLRLLASKGIDQVYAVGLSAGALLALRLALELPPRVRGLVLIGGSVYTDAHTRAITERWAETYAQEGSDGLTLRLLKDLYYPDWIEAHMEVVDQLGEQMRKADFRGPALWANEALKFDERNRIAQLSVPTLIVQAMDDQVVDAAHGRILRQSIPGAQLRILAQTGHLVPIERPKETAEAIGAFVDGVERPRTDAPAGRVE